MDEQEVPYDATGERDWFRLRLELTAKSVGPELFPDPLEVVVDLRPPPEKQRHSLTFIVFPAGEYRLGSPEFKGGDPNLLNDEDPRIVRISRAVALCDREITWALYGLFGEEKGRNRVQTDNGWDLSDDDAVCNQSWYDWVEFCRWLTREWRGDEESWQCYPDAESLAKDSDGNPDYGEMLLDRRGFRMPTESEWELAARSGQLTEYAFGGDERLLSNYGWFHENSGERPRVTALKPPTIGGLFDAHGNLSEWTHDLSGDVDGQKVLVDWQGKGRSSHRVCRGGGWGDHAESCRCAFRDSEDPSYRVTDLGFRLALSLPSGQSPDAEQAKGAEPFGGNAEAASAEQRPDMP